MHVGQQRVYDMLGHFMSTHTSHTRETLCEIHFSSLLYAFPFLTKKSWANQCDVEPNFFTPIPTLIRSLLSNKAENNKVRKNVHRTTACVRFRRRVARPTC